MASTDDILAVVRGLTQNVSQLVKAMGAPGRTVSAATSPLATLQTALGTTSMQVVSFNPNRRAISFHSCDQTNNSAIYLTPLTTATVAQGLYLAPGSSYLIPPDCGANTQWAAVAGTSACKLMVLEFV